MKIYHYTLKSLPRHCLPFAKRPDPYHYLCRPKFTEIHLTPGSKRRKELMQQSQNSSGNRNERGHPRPSLPWLGRSLLCKSAHSLPHTLSSQFGTK